MLYRIATLENSERLPMTLFKRDSTANIFLEIFNFFGQAISKNSSKSLILIGFYLLRMSNDYSFHGIPEEWDPGPQGETRNPTPFGGTLRWDLRVGS